MLYCWYFKYGILGWYFAFQIQIAERIHFCTKTSTHSIYCQIGHFLLTFSFNISQVLTKACLQERVSLWILHTSMNAVFSSFCHWRLTSHDPTRGRQPSCNTLLHIHIATVHRCTVRIPEYYGWKSDILLWLVGLALFPLPPLWLVTWSYIFAFPSPKLSSS